MPTTLVQGDEIDIPITVYNNKGTDQKVSVTITDGGSLLPVQVKTIPKNSKVQIVHTLKGTQIGQNVLSVKLTVDNID